MNPITHQVVTAIAHEVTASDPYCALQEPELETIAKRYRVQFLGRGVARAAFLIHGHVYKFLRYPSSDVFGSQTESEIENYYRLIRAIATYPEKFKGWGIPKMRFLIVNGQYVVRTEPIMGKEVEAWDNPFHIGDSHSGNARRVGDTIYLLDLA